MHFPFFNKKKKETKSQDEIIIPLPKFEVRYTYEWKKDVPENERDTKEHPARPFCRKLLELKRYYTRTNIQEMSQFLGYDVMRRAGGEGCRHEWVSHIVQKKE